MMFCKPLQATRWVFSCYILKQETCSLSPLIWHFTRARNISQVEKHVTYFPSSWLSAILKKSAMSDFNSVVHWITTRGNGKLIHTACIITNVFCIMIKQAKTFELLDRCFYQHNAMSVSYEENQLSWFAFSVYWALFFFLVLILIHGLYYVNCVIWAMDCLQT
jgi:hypothetical protein